MAFQVPNPKDDHTALWRKVLLNQVEKYPSVVGLEIAGTKDETPEVIRKVAYNSAVISNAGLEGL